MWVELAVASATLVASALAYLAASGLFTRVRVEARACPPPLAGEVTLIYKAGRCRHYKEVAEIVEEARLLTGGRPGLGIFYDDPDSLQQELGANAAGGDPTEDQTPEEEPLRYAVGSLLCFATDGCSGDRQGTSTTDLDPELLERAVTAGFRLTVLPGLSYAVTASFALRTRLSLHTAVFRLYPAVRRYIAAHGLCAYPAIEVLTDREFQVRRGPIPRQSRFYSPHHLPDSPHPASFQLVLPLSKQDEFFVPEFCEEQVSIATTEMSTRTEAGGGPARFRRSCSSKSSSVAAKDFPDRWPVGDSVKEDNNDGGGGSSHDHQYCGDHGHDTQSDEVVFVKPSGPAPRKPTGNPSVDRSIRGDHVANRTRSSVE